MSLGTKSFKILLKRMKKIKDDFLVPMNIKEKITNIVPNIAREEFVKEMSNPLNSNGKIFFISNCDNGLANSFSFLEICIILIYSLICIY